MEIQKRQYTETHRKREANLVSPGGGRKGHARSFSSFLNLSSVFVNDFFYIDFYNGFALHV